MVSSAKWGVPQPSIIFSPWQLSSEQNHLLYFLSAALEHRSERKGGTFLHSKLQVKAQNAVQLLLCLNSESGLRLWVQRGRKANFSENFLPEGPRLWGCREGAHHTKILSGTFGEAFGKCVDNSNSPTEMSRYPGFQKICLQTVVYYAAKMINLGPE